MYVGILASSAKVWGRMCKHLLKIELHVINTFVLSILEGIVLLQAQLAAAAVTKGVAAVKETSVQHIMVGDCIFIDSEESGKVIQ